jgi:hypothetical protein
MDLNKPEIGELYWTPVWFNAKKFSFKNKNICHIDVGTVVCLLSLIETDKYVEIKFLSGAEIYSISFEKKTFLKKFNKLFILFKNYQDIAW